MSWLVLSDELGQFTPPRVMQLCSASITAPMLLITGRRLGRGRTPPRRIGYSSEGSRTAIPPGFSATPLDLAADERFPSFSRVRPGTLRHPSSSNGRTGDFMAGSRQALALGYEGMGEAELVAQARDRHQDAFRVIMQRCNPRCSGSPAASSATMPKPRTSCRKPIPAPSTIWTAFAAKQVKQDRGLPSVAKFGNQVGRESQRQGR